MTALKRAQAMKPADLDRVISEGLGIEPIETRWRLSTDGGESGWSHNHKSKEEAEAYLAEHVKDWPNSWAVGSTAHMSVQYKGFSRDLNACREARLKLTGLRRVDYFQYLEQVAVSDFGFEAEWELMNATALQCAQALAAVVLEKEGQ